MLSFRNPKNQKPSNAGKKDMMRASTKRPPTQAQNRLFRLGLLSLSVPILLFVSCLYVAWLTDFEWWNGSAWFRKEASVYPHYSEEVYNNLKYQFGKHGKAYCPAKVGLELRDYWECLWRNTITMKGRQQNERIVWALYNERMALEAEAIKLQARIMNKTRKIRRIINKDTNNNKRVRKRRQILQFNESDPKTYFTYQKVRNYMNDIQTGLRTISSKCQQEVIPGVSIHKFLDCLKRGGSGLSLHPTFQPTKYPVINESEYPVNEYELPPERKHQTTGATYKLAFDFQPLGMEENLQNFDGADPYLESSFSVYRYRYNNLNTRQRQPAWTYRGKDGAPDWHLLDLEKFYLPLRKNIDLRHAEFVSDFAQTYPGMGVIAFQLKHVDAPLEPRWSKDSGFSAYTRYLLPFFESYDLDYYKSKKMIDSSVTPVPDRHAIQQVIIGIDKFVQETQAYIYNDTGDMPNPAFSRALDAPYAKAYLDFMRNFMGVDTGEYKSLKDQIDNPTNSERDLFWEMERIRTLLHKYVAAVRTGESCLLLMLDASQKDVHGRAFVDENSPLIRVDSQEHQEEFEEMMNRTISAPKSTGCWTAANESLVIAENQKPTATRFTMDARDLPQIYTSYFERREARQRYTLHMYPVSFPICRNSEPSPIDIKVDQSRESSIRDYHFGRAAYALQRFFMFFPLDGSPLLTVGIVDGQRLDESSVRLSGGAVKADTNLTLQYIHFNYASDWRKEGSEHRINGKGAPMEMQMVFTISGSADSIKYWHILARVHNQLFQFREKLVIILSVLVDVLATDDEVRQKIDKDELDQDPLAFEALAQAAYHFRKMPDKYPSFEEPRGYVSVDPVLRFIDLIPRTATRFYTYRGSLSWPPCFGYVIRSVFEQRLYMSKRQFDHFVTIPAYGVQEGSYANDNFRRFDDIYVEQENDPGLKFEEIQAMIKERTVDRFILNGYHSGVEEYLGYDVIAKAASSIVGKEVYYNLDSSKGILRAKPLLITCVILFIELSR